MLRRRFLLSAAAAGVVPAIAQQASEKKWYVSSPRRTFVAPELRDAPDEWIERSFAWVEDVLTEFKPSVPEHPVRRAALTRLDDILHIESAPRKPLVHRFFRARMEHAGGEIESTRVTTGARVWKLYNHSFLVRTPTVSFTYDLVPGPPGNASFSIEAPLLERLVRQSDANFISHPHSDHVHAETIRLFVGANKPVVAPEPVRNLLPADLANRLIIPERSATAVHTVPVQAGERKLELIAYPGHQGSDVICNCCLVRTPERFATLHTGDQSNEADFAWIAHVGARQSVDVLLPNCWTPDLQRMLRGVNPRLVITGHENEMAHPVSNREDYAHTYQYFHGSGYPFQVMAWGESYGVNG